MKKEKSRGARIHELAEKLSDKNNTNWDVELVCKQKTLECILAKYKRGTYTTILYWEAVQPRRIHKPCYEASHGEKGIKENVAALECFVFAAFIPGKPAAIMRFNDEGAVVFATHCVIPPDWVRDESLPPESSCRPFP